MIRTLFVAGMILLMSACSSDSPSDSGEPNPPNPPPAAGINEVEFWLTSGNQTALLQKQNVTLSFGTTANNHPIIEVDSTQKFQSVDGFGYTLTSGSAELINALNGTIKQNLLNEIFGSGENSIQVRYLRISIGASDLSSSVYTYNDIPQGQTDPTISQFSLQNDQAGGTGLIPLLKEILAVNSSIKILATPWTPPVWMKTNGSSVGGKLKTEFYAAYAQYFVKYIQAMKAEGIRIDAITPQNEPLHPGNNPSMEMTAPEQLDFIKNHLGPAFANANIDTKIIIYDHNCDKPEYPITILDDAAAKAFVDGSAFHLYAGDISTMSSVRNKHPEKNIYFTEQYTGGNGDFAGDFKWHMRNVIIGSMRNWSRVALEWNLANDSSYGPHTPGGCTDCKGAVTIIGASTIQRNVSYYIIGQISKFVPPGSVRITSNTIGDLKTVAFERPDKKKVLIVLNDGDVIRSFNLRFKNKWTVPTIPANSAATFIW